MKNFYNKLKLIKISFIFYKENIEFNEIELLTQKII